LKVNLSQPGKINPAKVEEVSTGCFNGELPPSFLHRYTFLSYVTNKIASFTPQQDGEWKVVITYQGQDVVEHKMNVTGSMSLSSIPLFPYFYSFADHIRIRRKSMYCHEITKTS
jgi:hypothetical protein